MDKERHVAPWKYQIRRTGQGLAVKSKPKT
jgi:hypothetical protein